MSHTTSDLDDKVLRPNTLGDLELPPGALPEVATESRSNTRPHVRDGSTETEARIFTTIDKIKFFIISSVGFFSDGYFNSSWSYVVTMIGVVYWDGGSIPTLKQDLVKAGLSIGMIGGMLTFGIFGDALGRHKVYGKELAFTLLGTFMIVMTPWRNFSQQSVIGWLTFWRVFTGFGIGGDYPMSGALNGETKLGMSRSRLILTSFFIYTLGSFIFLIFYLILITAYKNRVNESLDYVNYVWRIAFGLGLIPGIASLYERWTMKETKPYEKYVAKETGVMGHGKTQGQVRNISDQWADFYAYFNMETSQNRRHVSALCGTALTWFFFDIAIYGVSLNNANIIKGIGYGTGKTHGETLYNTAVGGLIVGVFSIPGTAIGIFLPDLIGRWWHGVGSCLLASGLYAVWAGIEGHTGTTGLMVIYAISQMVMSGGPNLTTFLYPIECFPTRVRGTAHGISAASGKCGALLTAFAFGYLNASAGLRGAIGLCAGVMFIAALTNTLVPEVKGLTLDDIENGVQYLSRKDRLAHIHMRDNPSASSSPAFSVKDGGTQVGIQG